MHRAGCRVLFIPQHMKTCYLSLLLWAILFRLYRECWALIGWGGERDKGVVSAFFNLQILYRGLKLVLQRASLGVSVEVSRCWRVPPWWGWRWEMNMHIWTKMCSCLCAWSQAVLSTQYPRALAFWGKNTCISLSWLWSSTCAAVRLRSHVSATAEHLELLRFPESCWSSQCQETYKR